VLSNEHPVYL